MLPPSICHPVTISADDIKIAEAVLGAIKDSLCDEISNMIEEKTEQIQLQNMNVCRNLEKLEQY